MENVCRGVKIAESVYWVGAVDWSIRDFHGYSTNRGTTYNAYLILADKITLIDTVKRSFQQELLSRIASIVEPSRIDYIVSNHSEMDHTGCLPEMIDVVRPEKVFASPLGVKAIREHFHVDLGIEAVGTGDRLDLGGMHLEFLETRMLHWPDSMVAYMPQRRILFSQDAFGMHLATSERFEDEISSDIIRYEALKYYTNILLPYSSQVTRNVEKIRDMQLEIDVIASDHGPIWRNDVHRAFQWYLEWAGQPSREKAVIVYDTMWGSTAHMANAIGDGMAMSGIHVKQMPLGGNHRSDIVTELLDAGVVIVGSPTLNNMIYPTVADFLTYLKGLKPRNLAGIAFGSYGWSGEALKQIKGHLSEMNIEVIGDIQARYVPSEGDLRACFALGAEVAKRLKGDGQ